MIDYDKIKEELEPDDIIKIIQHFIPDLNYEENTSNGCLILPTICHNLEQEDGSKNYIIILTLICFIVILIVVALIFMS